MKSSESNTLDKYKNFPYCHFSKWFPHEWIASNWLQLPLGWPRHDWKNLIKLSRIVFQSLGLFVSPMEKAYFRKHLFDSSQNSDVWQSNFDFRFPWLPKSHQSIRFFPKLSVNFKFGSPKNKWVSMIRHF